MKAEVHNKVKVGLKWNMVNQIVTQVVFVWFGIYLARLLGPDAYGLVGMITVFSGFANIFVDFGFTSAIIYFQDLDNNKLSSVFWFNMGMGILIYLLFYCISPFIADFYNEPKLDLLTKVVTLSVIINSFGSLQNALLSKNIDFKAKITTSWISTIISYIIAFYLAYKGYGVWSLVFQILSVALINNLFLWFITNWRPKFYFSLANIKPMFKYGSGIAGTNILGYITRNLDNVIVGKFLGNAALGLYSRSYGLMMVPLTNISSVFNKVMFPAFAKMQGDLKAFGAYYLKIVKLIALITFPMMFGLSSISKEFVLLFLGPKWNAAIPIISMLSILGAFQSILSLNGILYNSTGNSLKAFKVTMYFNLILIPSWIIGLKIAGLQGLVIGYVLLGTIGALPIWISALRVINVTLFTAFSELKIIFIASLSFFIVNIIYDSFDFGLIQSLAIKIITSILIYVTFIYTFDNLYFKTILKKISNKL